MQVTNRLYKHDGRLTQVFAIIYLFREEDSSEYFIDEAFLD